MDRATIDVYEARAVEWRAQRSPRNPDRAVALAADARALSAQPVVDLGCGPGWFTDDLGGPTIALDASHAMLDLTAVAAPSASLVRASIDALPFRRGSLSGAFASKVYVHLPATEVPLALADLHRALTPGAPVELELFGGDEEFASFEHDDFAGRRFSLWRRAHLGRVLEGAGFTIDRWQDRTRASGHADYLIRCTRARTLADHVARGMRVLLCGLNPSVYAADAGVGFARPGNRFWPAALASGIVTRDRDARHALVAHGVGMTDLVKRATVRADELTAAEFRDGVERVEALCAWLRPRVVCMVGLTGWRLAVDKHAQPGLQVPDLGGVPVYVMPNPSGLNAHARVDDLVAHLRAAAQVAARSA
jgi:TDG/mug DNA glycosylase family protein